MQWLESFTSAEEAWNQCKRGDWMLWLVGKLSGPPEGEGRKKLVLASCDCASLALNYTNDLRVGECINVARRWAHGEATILELRIARNTAYDAASAAYAADAADAAYDAASAASAAAYAADAAAADAAVDAAYAAYAYDAASAAAYAADAAADAAAVDAAAAADSDSDAAYAAVYARNNLLKQYADIVRKHYPKPPKITAEREEADADPLTRHEADEEEIHGGDIADWRGRHDHLE